LYAEQYLVDFFLLKNTKIIEPQQQQKQNEGKQRYVKVSARE